MRQPRRSPYLSERVEDLLNSYALAAGAAGVSLLALAQPAEARVVYTPAHVMIGRGGVRHWPLDLNHDDKPDFDIRVGDKCVSYLTSGSCEIFSSALRASGASAVKGNAVAGKAPKGLAFALRVGNRVGPQRPLDGKTMAYLLICQCGTYKTYGEWQNVTNRYLGLRFKIHGRTHYGWARLNVQIDIENGPIATLTGYAYETIPNKPIVAGHRKGPQSNVNENSQATLGALAAGSPALSIWRAEDDFR